jgi:hypothetical protein
MTAIYCSDPSFKQNFYFILLKPELPPGQTRRPKGSITRHEVTVCGVVYCHGHKADQELKNREKQREACEAALEEFSRKLNKSSL